MNRRDFLKSTLAVAALAPVARLAAKAGPDGDKASDIIKGSQVTRRKYKDTGLTVPLLGPIYFSVIYFFIASVPKQGYTCTN